MKRINFIENRELIVLCTIYILFRLTILFFSPHLFDSEEFHMGLIAKEVINGPGLPLFEYQSLYGPHHGGLTVQGILIAPLFLLFGESGVSLKLLWFFMYLATLITMFLFLKKFFDRKVAIISSLLFIFSPQYFTIRNLTESGPIAGIILLGFLIIYQFYNIFFNKKNSLKWFVLLGLTCGFALFYGLSSLVMIFTCMLFWFIFDKRFFLKKEFFIFIIFFLIGFSPSLYYNFTHDFEGYWPLKPSNFFQDNQNKNFIFSYSSMFLKFATKDFPESLNFIDTDRGEGYIIEHTNYLKFLNYNYSLIFFVSLIFLVYYNKNNLLKVILSLNPLRKSNILTQKILKEIFILTYLFIFLVVYLDSRFQNTVILRHETYNHISLLYPFVFIIISLFTVKLMQGGYFKKIISVLLLIFVLLLGLLANINLVSFTSFKDNSQFNKSYDYSFLAESLILRFTNKGGTDIDGICKMFDEQSRVSCYSGYGQFLIGNNDHNTTKSIEECNLNPEQYVTDCYTGIAIGLGGYNVSDMFNLAIDGCKKLPKELHSFCFYRLGRGLIYKLGNNNSMLKERCFTIKEKYRYDCYQGAINNLRGHYTSIHPSW